MDFSRFQRPSRYINSELNAIYKGSSGRAHVSIALCFPDLYEVGMSHLGLRILYDIINQLPYASAERAFSPWIDLEAYMKKQGILLSSLETQTPLRDFDIVGFSLQYELSYTTVLNMLSMGGIPLYADKRHESNRSLPLVIAGGPCTVNPAPMAPFFDAFLIGDGEEAVVELMDTVRLWKQNGDGKRESLLAAIGLLNGFYVPSLHTGQHRIKRRFIKTLDDAPFPVKPVVPYMGIVHDRVTIEVSRGCTMGCRFCQAGMIYRPLRERSPEQVLAIAESSLKNTGHDEVSLSSLSAGDYPYLLALTRDFNKRFGQRKIALSLPSLRVGAVNRDVVREIRSVRKTGFTIAPEAATERLRSVINKDFCDDDYERALSILFEEGWTSLKLYFMIGLPTERDEDIAAIRGMALRAFRIAKKHSRRFISIGVTVSPFIPKPHTPFQWCGQISHQEMKERLSLLKKVLIAGHLAYKGHDDRMSLLEAMFARGDERLAQLVVKAWELGCRLDGWSDVFDYAKWTEAMSLTGIDGYAYATRRFSGNDRMPWNCVDPGVQDTFLLDEYQKAMGAEKTQDCRNHCNACGPAYHACHAGNEKKHGERKNEHTINPLQERDATSICAVQTMPPVPKKRMRVRFSKGAKLRCLSHLEVMSAILRSLRRAGVPLEFTKGFRPSPKVSFGPPLSVGVAGKREYFDMEVSSAFDAELFREKINKTLPEGVFIHKIAAITANSPSLDSFISRYEYEISPNGASREKPSEKKVRNALYDRCSRLFAHPVMVKRDSEKTDLASCIENISLGETDKGRASVIMTLKDYNGTKVRIGEFLDTVFSEDKHVVTVVRTALYGWENGWREPI